MKINLIDEVIRKKVNKKKKECDDMLLNSI